MEKRAKVTRLVLEHVERADDALKNFRDNGVSAEGVLTHPALQSAALKVAREELQKAIALIERTTTRPKMRNWLDLSGRHLPRQ